MLPDPRRLPALVETLAGVLPRAMGLLDDAEVLLNRADALIDRIETTRLAAHDVVERTDQVVSDANALIVRSTGTIASAEPSIERAQRLFDTLGPTLEQLGPVAEDLMPTLRRLADTTHPDEVDAAIGLIDKLPLLVTRLEGDVLPVLATLGTVGPDIHDLLELVSDLAAMLEKIPGISRRPRED